MEPEIRQLGCVFYLDLAAPEWTFVPKPAKIPCKRGSLPGCCSSGLLLEPDAASDLTRSASLKAGPLLMSPALSPPLPDREPGTEAAFVPESRTGV